MSSASPRVGLTIMGDSDFVDPGIVDKNSTQLDLITSVEQALSGVRPNPAFDGQHIYETDTKNFRRYDLASASWYLLGSGPSGGAAQGLVGTFSNATAGVVSGSGSGPPNWQVATMLDYSFSVVAGRAYKIVEQGWLSITGTPANVTESTSIMEAYTLFQVGSNPALNSLNGLHYSQYWYNANKWGSRVPFYRPMNYSASATGTLFLRSCVRTDASFWSTTTRIGRPADTIGSYAWAFDLGPSGSSY